MQRDIYDILQSPVISEKSMSEQEARKYVFTVPLYANKIEIKQAVEKIFGVKVQSVKTMITLGKYKRMGVHRGKRPDKKKAIVQLKEGSKSIEYFEGVN